MSLNKKKYKNLKNITITIKLKNNQKTNRTLKDVYGKLLNQAY